MEYGGQCVMTPGMKEMLQLYADSWGLMKEVCRTTIILTSMSHKSYCIKASLHTIKCFQVQLQFIQPSLVLESESFT